VRLHPSKTPPPKNLSLLMQDFYRQDAGIGALGNNRGVPSSITMPRAGSVVVRIDPLHLLARYRKRRINQALSIFLIVQFFDCVIY